MPDLIFAIDENTCVECGNCRRYCPVAGAIIINENYQHTILADVCTGCGICESFCPIPNTIFPLWKDQSQPLSFGQIQAIERLNARRRVIWRDRWYFGNHPVMGAITLAARRRLRDTATQTRQ